MSENTTVRAVRASKSEAQLQLAQSVAALAALRETVKTLKATVAAERAARKEARASSKVEKTQKREASKAAKLAKLQARIEKDRLRLAKLTAKEHAPKNVKRHNKKASPVRQATPEEIAEMNMDRAADKIAAAA